MSVDLEKILRPVDQPMAPFPAKYVTLASGEPMVIRQIDRDEVPDVLPHIEPLIHVERDFYDLVAARVYAELLSYSRHRVQDEYVLVAQIHGELAAVVNGRQVTPELGMSLHTIALRRGLRIGAHSFAAKMEYHLDILGHDAGAHRRRVADRVPPLDDRVPAREALRYAPRAGRRAVVGTDPGAVRRRARQPRRRATPGAGRTCSRRRRRRSCRRRTRRLRRQDLMAATRAMYDPTGTALMLERWAHEGRPQPCVTSTSPASASRPSPGSSTRWPRSRPTRRCWRCATPGSATSTTSTSPTWGVPGSTTRRRWRARWSTRSASRPPAPPWSRTARRRELRRSRRASRRSPPGCTTWCW